MTANEPASEFVSLTNDEKEAARAWLYAHNGDEGGGLGGLWEMVGRIVAERLAANTDYHLAMHQAYRPEVVAEVAVHLGSHEDWARLVEWTGGRIETSQDPSGEYASVLVLPNGEAGGDWAWLVLDHSGAFHFRAEVAAPEPANRPGSSGADQ